MKQRKSNWTAAIMITIAMTLVCNLVGCRDPFAKQETIVEIITRQAAEAKPKLWIEGSNKSVGPRFYVTGETIALPDGSRVVCLSTYYALWCKEAKTE